MRGPQYEASCESCLGIRRLSSSNVQAAGIVRQPSAGMLKREIPGRIWGELYWALSFPGRGLQSAGLSLHCLCFPG